MVVFFQSLGQESLVIGELIFKFLEEWSSGIVCVFLSCGLDVIDGFLCLNVRELVVQDLGCLFYGYKGKVVFVFVILYVDGISLNDI